MPIARLGTIINKRYSRCQTLFGGVSGQGWTQAGGPAAEQGGAASGRPRSAIVAITKDDGGVIAL